VAANDEHVSTLRGMLRYYTGKQDQSAILAAIRALSAQQPEAVAWCDPADPINAAAFAWPGTARDASRHTMPLYAAQPQGAVSDAECVWEYDGSQWMWNSSCGEAWVFTEGGPEDNNYRYCHGCGKKVHAVRPEAGEVES